MNAVQCDRCKKFYLESDDSLERPSYAGVRIYSVELQSNAGNHIKSFDLCTDCAKKLYSFLKGSDTEKVLDGVIYEGKPIRELSPVTPEPFINKPCISEGVCHEDKMQVLDKLRAEIEQIADEEQKHDKLWATGLRYAVKIIDKYRTKESEVNDGNS